MFSKRLQDVPLGVLEFSSLWLRNTFTSTWLKSILGNKVTGTVLILFKTVQRCQIFFQIFTIL